jgi:Ca-activated chloride channel family protein
MLLPLLFTILAFQRAGTDRISGTITDDNGNPVAGINIVVKGTAIATTSGPGGHFTINVPDKKNSILIISGIGYVPKEVKVSGRTTLNVKLSFLGQELKERQSRIERSKRIAQKMSFDANAAIPQGVRGSANWYYHRDSDGGYDDFNTEDYDHISENMFLKVKDNPVSTFSIDVDAASYSNIRRILNQGQLPPAGAVRIEEMINYFKYDYPEPKDDQPFSINMEISGSPWNKDHKLVLIGLQGRKIPNEFLACFQPGFFNRCIRFYAVSEQAPIGKRIFKNAR